MNKKPNQSLEKKLTYKDSGVDIDKGNQLVEEIKEDIKNTLRPEVIGGIGGFGSLFKMPTGYKKPVLVSGTDGVGTKLKIAIETGVHSGIGIDLVAMCVNDLIVAGAEPLFFLDYYATDTLDIKIAKTVIGSIAEGCKLSGASLVGGETAEMPGMYKKGDYDLAGFCVGIVEEDEIIDGRRISHGDSIIALASSGPYSNGYSLIRKIIKESDEDINAPFSDSSLVKKIMEPTKIYVKSILELRKNINIHGIAHITGGGLTENIPRVLPCNTQANIDCNSWKMPEIFQWLQSRGNIDLDEMYKTFNCGVGLILIIPNDATKEALEILTKNGEDAWIIGNIEENQLKSPFVNFV